MANQVGSNFLNTVSSPNQLYFVQYPDLNASNFSSAFLNLYSGGAAPSSDTVNVILREITVNQFSSASNPVQDPKQTFLGFMNAMLQGTTPPPTAFATDQAALNSSLGQLLYKNFLESQGINFTTTGGQISVSSPLTGDWAPFQSMISSTNQPPLDSVNNFVSNAFFNSFNQFVQTYSWNNILYNANGVLPNGSNALVTTGTGSELTGFIQGYGNYLAQLSSIGTTPFGSGGSNPSQPSLGNSPIPVTTYYSIYNAFVQHNTNTGDPTTDTDFQQALAAFYQQSVSQNGYFIPSQFLGKWMAYVQQIGSTVKNGTGILPVSSSPSDASKLDVLDSVLKVLIKTINSVQSLTANEAQRLTYYANYQKAYSDLISKIPTILNVGNVSDPNVQSQIRTAAQSLNAQYNTLLTGYQDQEGNQGKAVQAGVDNLNQNVNQLATTVQTLLTLIATLGKTVLTK